MLGPAVGGGAIEPRLEDSDQECVDGDGAMGVSGVSMAEDGDGGTDP